MRLIDGDKLVNTIVFHTDMPSEYKEQVEDTIQDAPTIDAVPVVRCENCIFYEKVLSVQGFCNNYESIVYVNDFCSYGSRREDGEV